MIAIKIEMLDIQLLSINDANISYVTERGIKNTQNSCLWEQKWANTI